MGIQQESVSASCFVFVALVAGAGIAGCSAGGPKANSSSAASTTSCTLPVAVDPLKSIEIVHPNVVSDARSSNAAGGGPWSFAKLITNVAPSSSQSDVDALLRGIFESFGVAQTINGENVPATSVNADPVIFRQGSTTLSPPDPTQDFVITGTGPGTSNQRSFNLANAPFQLLAIANRLDLADTRNFTAIPNAGEGRFVFSLTRHAGNFSVGMTLIMEFKLLLIAGNPQFDTPAHWAQTWHQLDSLDPSNNPAQYNQVLQSITDAFTSRGAASIYGVPNGSAISQIRTNDGVLANGFPQLREFNMNTAGLMVPATTKNSPQQELISLDGESTLTNFVNNNAGALTASNFLKFDLQGAGIPIGGKADQDPGQGAPCFGGDTCWIDPNANQAALTNFAQLTCNGCHEQNKAPADTHRWFQVDPTTDPGSDGTGRLSLFMTMGNSQNGGVSELQRRTDDMGNRLCTDANGAGPGLSWLGGVACAQNGTTINCSGGQATAGQDMTLQMQTYPVALGQNVVVSWVVTPASGSPQALFLQANWVSNGAGEYGDNSAWTVTIPGASVVSGAASLLVQATGPDGADVVSPFALTVQ